MAKDKKDHVASYKPLVNKARFWLYSEACYTEEELNLREWILKTRTNSGIHPDYLINPSSWFAEDTQALINAYDNSWFYSPAFKTRHILNRDDFHVQPIDSQRLQWPALYDLMQKVGDYLLIRNQNLPTTHLNQPMNFVLLDINNMLKHLSQNTNIAQVKAQLEFITRYVRTIETTISPEYATDRVFLANFRSIVDTTIHPQLTHMIESQLLRERLGELSKTIHELSTNRNRILHFALNINPVNPHPYQFSVDKPDDAIAYPTQAAKECAQGVTDILVNADPHPILFLTVKQLHDCPKFKLISMDEDILYHYSKAISDLNELERFQDVITQIMALLGKAGEMYTIHQFKNQMTSLLGQIEMFIDQSSQHIEAIIQENTRSYNKAIEEEQNLSLLKKWFTSEQLILKTFIKNQDTLAQFPSSSTDLIKTNGALKTQVNQVLSHLNQPRSIETSFEAIAGQVQELDRLMASMHQWIKIQYEMQGLPAPTAPESLHLLTNPIVRPLSLMPPSFEEPLYENMNHHPPLFSHPPSTTQICTFNYSRCQFNPTPIMEPQYPQTGMTHLGLMAMIPVGIIALLILLKGNKEKKASQLPSKDRCH